MLPLLISLLQPMTLGETPRDVKLDGRFEDWSGRGARLIETVVEGAPLEAADDLRATVHFAFDGKHLLLGVEVVDDVFQPGPSKRGDRLEIHAGGRIFEVVLNDLEGKQPFVTRNKRRVKGAKAVGLTRIDGWAVELSLPVDALPPAREVPTPFAVRVLDADDWKVKADTTLSTDLPTLRLDPSAGLYERYTAEEGMHDTLRRARGNVVGDERLEDVVVNTRDLVVLGPRLPGGPGYMFFTLGWGEGAELTELVLRDLDGRAGAELVVAHTEWEVPGEIQIEVLEVFGVRGGNLRKMFAQRVAERFPKMNASAESEWGLLRAARAHHIQVKVAVVRGLNAGNYVEADTGEAHPVPMPWRARHPVTYRLRDGTWALGK